MISHQSIDVKQIPQNENLIVVDPPLFTILNFPRDKHINIYYGTATREHYE